MMDLMIFELNVAICIDIDKKLLDNVMMDCKHFIWPQPSLLQFTPSQVNGLVKSVTCDGKKLNTKGREIKPQTAAAVCSWLNRRNHEVSFISINITLVFCY